MNVSYRWLKALAPAIQGTPQEVADRLALLGAPVDEIVDLGAGIGGVVVARVTDVRPHPNADKLRICTVDAGAGEPLQVVCGAPNVEAGRFYPFAPVGATLPGGLAIKKAKLRGEASEGMLCSARELGLGRDHAGLMTLAGEYALGTSFRDALELDDARLVVDVTPNRPELLSHVGVAREAAPGGAEDVHLPSFPNAPTTFPQIVSAGATGSLPSAGVEIVIEDVAGCPRYMAAVVRGVKVGASPEWLATRLRAVGVRPINNVVDATNFVLLELGQPLHAFDLAKLRGGQVRIRRASPDEKFTTLDGTERTLLATDLMIADGERSVGIAGVMGGENSEVGDDTTDLLIECALFDPLSVRKTSRRLGLSTDASYRFERGVDPEGQALATRRVCDLIVSVAGGRVEEVVDLNPTPFQRPRISLRPRRVEKLLGVYLPTTEIGELLRSIGFGVEGDGGSADAMLEDGGDAAGAGDGALTVSVPGFRPDVTGEIDLIEEIARRRGYESFAEELRPFRPSEVPDDALVAVERRVREVFVARGFLEARTAAFAPEAGNTLRLLNPLSAEEGFLRSSLAPGLLRRVEHNFAHGVRDVRLFSVGTVFAAGGAGEMREEMRFAAVLTGASRPASWTGEAPPLDTWDLKGLMEELSAEFPQGAVQPGEWDALAPVTDPSVRFRLVSAGDLVGGGGLVAPAAVDAPAWAAPVFVVEARMPAKLADRRGVLYRELPVFPASERDMALLVPLAVASAEVEAAIRESAGPLLEAVFPFDLYEGKGIPDGTRSLAWRLRFRTPDRTLTDAEVDKSVQRVLAALQDRHGIARR
ncbi:MAG TPA: phenylalanine--tRNA ligase subunit beta [Longimicrobiaceae bacterium]|jgi:phenylalanyl-tRNA synthetase beta chain|nr:phenylalanine--tRNA ligase subunit beta [Longimicrobiaceae bacterium]